MILTGSQIAKEMKCGNITIEPFNLSQINPNSYNYRLGNIIKCPVKFNGEKMIFETLEIPPEGMILEKGNMYLGHTYERIGSSRYMTSLIGRSSMGRLGMFLQLSANVGHTGTVHRWTLEIYPTKNIRIYPGMIVGQVSFWSNNGDYDQYEGGYGTFNIPQESLI